MATLNLIYALKDGKTVHISDVESGLKCGCICPACQKPLIAKKGAKRTPHFAHKNGGTCEYGYESSLHLAAKEIISNDKEKGFVIPPAYLRFPGTHKTLEYIPQAMRIPVTRVELETRYGGFVPDIVIYSGEQQLFVEIFVTHPIDDEKLEKLKSAGISTIEIDLSKRDRTISKEELRRILLDGSKDIYWKYNAYEDKLLKRFYSVSDEKNIILYGRSNISYVKDCPLKKSFPEDGFYANYQYDCLSCEYCISADITTNKILCSGKKRISKLEDFEISEEERIKKSDERIEAEKKREEKERKQREARRIQWEARREEERERHRAYRTAPKCPYCSSKLILKNGIWKCQNCGYKAETMDQKEYK